MKEEKNPGNVDEDRSASTEMVEWEAVPSVFQPVLMQDAFSAMLPTSMVDVVYDALVKSVEVIGLLTVDENFCNDLFNRGKEMKKSFSGRSCCVKDGERDIC